MAGDDEVLIKIAADVASANAAILSVGTTLESSLGAANETASATTAIVQILTSGFESLGNMLGIVAQNIGEMNQGVQTVVGVFEGMAAGAKEAEDAAKAAGEGVGGVGKQVDEVGKKTKKLTEEAVTWGTLMADAIKNISASAGEALKAFPAMVAGQAAAGEQLNVLANRLDLTADATRELQYVSDLSGVNMNVMAKASQGLSASLQDIDSKASKAVKSIGLFPEELNKLSKTEAMSKIVEQIRQLPPGIDKSAKMIEIFGAKASQMTGLLKEDLPAIHKEFSNLVDEKAIADSARLGNEFGGAMTKIQLVMEETKRSMSNAVLPAVNAVLEALPGLGGAALLAGQSLYKVGESMAPMVSNFALAQIQQKGFTAAMTEFGGSLTKVGKLVGEFGAGLMKLGKFLTTNPWGLLITAAMILLPILWDMVGGWEGIKKAIEPVITYFEDMYTIGKELADMFLGDLVAGVSELVGWFAEFFTSTDEGMGTLNGLIAWAKSWIDWLEQFPIVGQYIKIIKLELELLWAAAQKLWEWTTKFGSAIANFFKRVGKEAHDTAEGIRSLDAATAAATKQLEDQKKAKEDAAKGTKEQLSNMDRMKAKVDYLNSGYQSLTESQKASIKSMAAAGMSTKEIAEDMKSSIYHGIMSVDDVGKVVDRFKDKMKEAEAEAKKNPFKKLMEDATALSKALDLAAKAGIPLVEQIDEYGKKASEIAQKAAMRGELEKIPPKVVEMGRAWEQAQLATLMKKTDSAAADLARTFYDKLATAAAEVSASIVSMQGAITESALRGTELRLAQIEREKQASLAANAEKVRAKDLELAAIRDKEWDLAATEIENIKKTEGSITAARQAEIMVRHSAVIAGYTAENEALKAKYEDADAIIKMNAERQRMIAEGDLAYFEEVMAARGQVTKKALADQLATEKKTLELMKIEHAAFSTWQIEEQQRRVDALADLGEKEAKERGLITKKAGEIELAIQRSNLAFMQANKEKFYQWEIDAAKAVADKLSSAFQQEAKKRGLETKADVDERIRKAQEEYKWRVDHEKDFTKIQIEESKKRKQAAEAEANSAKRVWANAFKGMSQAGAAVGGVFEEIGRQGHDGMAKVGKAVTAASEIMGDVGGLLEAKDTIGMVIAAAKLAVTAIKAMWDAFSKSPGEDIVGRVGQRLGVVIGEEMGDTIAATAKEKFKGDRFAAEVFHLSDIIEAAGGITEKNFEKLLGGLRDTFTMLDSHMFTVEQARESLDKNFGVFADHVVKSGKVASAAFVEMIRLNKEMGVNSKEVTDFVKGQATALGGAFEKLVSPQLKASETQKDELKKLRDEWTKTDQEIGKLTLEDKGGMEVYKDLSKMSKEQKANLANLNIEWDRNTAKLKAAEDKQKQMAKEAMPALDRAGRLMTSTFNAAISSGVGFSEAVDQMGPGLDTVLKTMENLGISVEDSSVSWIVSFRNRINANKELVDSTGSLNDIMLGMSNIGALNEDSMRDLEAQGLESFTKLKEAGFQENEALKMMAGFLTTTRDAHAQMGIPIDENTASLIKQAEEAGIIKEQQLDTNKIMMEGLGAIIEAVGGKLPAAWKTAGEAAVDTAKTVADTVDDTVNSTIEDQEKLLQKQEKAWADEARAADKAALAMKKSMEKVDKAVGTVQDGLDDTDWEGWAKEAVDAAQDVEGAVTGVAEGHSPGGIKEIPIRLAQARDAFKIWERVGVTSAENLQDTIDSMRGRDLGMTGIRSDIRTAGVPTQMPSGDFVREVTQDEGKNNAPVNLTFNITSMDPAGVELVTERKILPAMVKILRRGRNLADMQTVLNLKG